VVPAGRASTFAPAIAPVAVKLTVHAADGQFSAAKRNLFNPPTNTKLLPHTPSVHDFFLDIPRLFRRSSPVLSRIFRGSSPPSRRPNINAASTQHLPDMSLMSSRHSPDISPLSAR
jgi:hypothetical protein